MLLLSKINKWGNSWGIRIPADYLKELGITDQSTVKIDLKKNTIVISKSDQPLTLDQLIANHQSEQLHPLAWPDAQPQGNEIW